MYAQLGKIVFEALIGFDEWARELEAKYAYHDLINTKPRTAATGVGLMQLKLGIQFHKTFCVPEDEIQAIEDAVNNKKILTLILGNGRIIGDFIIKKFTERILETDTLGNIIIARMSLDIEEYFIVDRTVLNQQAAQNSALALSENNPGSIRGTRKIYTTNASAITTNVAQAKSHATMIQGLINEANNVQEWIAYNSDRITKLCDAGGLLASIAKSIIDGDSALTALAPLLPASLTSLGNAFTNMKAAMPISSFNSVLSLNTTLQGAAGQSKLYNAPLTAGLIARRL